MRKEELSKEILANEAWQMELSDLCERVLRYSYTPGIHDEILLERCRKHDIGEKQNHPNERS